MILPGRVSLRREKILLRFRSSLYGTFSSLLRKIENHKLKRQFSFQIAEIYHVYLEQSTEGLKICFSRNFYWVCLWPSLLSKLGVAIRSFSVSQMILKRKDSFELVLFRSISFKTIDLTICSWSWLSNFFFFYPSSNFLL